MAELEILQALVSFFCPTSEAASTCREFIQNHSQVLPPIGPLFYFLLFPAVFTILFVLLLMDNVGVAKNRSPGIKVLLGITAFIFIIISGWYPIMLILSEFWYIIIILLGFLWFVTGHRDKKEGREGGGGKGAMSALGGTTGYLAERAFRVGGKIEEEQHIERRIKSMHGILNQMQHSTTEKDKAMHSTNFLAEMSQLEKDLETYKEILGIPVYEQLSKKYKTQIQKLNKSYENLASYSK